MIYDPNRIQLSRDQQADLAELAAATGKAWPVVLSEALADYRRERQIAEISHSPEESFADVAKRLGLLGCVTGGPADLSTNPEYLEGLGQ